MKIRLQQAKMMELFFHLIRLISNLFTISSSNYFYHLFLYYIPYFLCIPVFLFGILCKTNFHAAIHRIKMRNCILWCTVGSDYVAFFIKKSNYLVDVFSEIV